MADEQQNGVIRFAVPLLTVAALIPALGSLGAPFYGIDDRSMIVNNPVVTGAAPLSKVFTTPHFGHYAPLHELLIWVQWQIFGTQPLSYRIVSVLLHAGAAVACLAMLKNLTRRPALALGVAVLWAVHPIQPESVDWIAEQKTLWSGLFSFAALALYFNTERSRALRFGGGMALMILAGLGKSSALVVGPLILLYEICAPKRDWAAALPFVIMSGVFAALALWANNYTEGIIAWHISDTVLNLPGTLLIYLRTAFLPWTVSFFQDLNRIVSFSDPMFFGKLGAVLAIFAAGVFLAGATRRKLFVFSALAWALALGPMLNVSATTFPAYDRFQYLALPFLLLGAALMIEPWLERFLQPQPSGRIPELHAHLWSVVLLVVATLGYQRGTMFANEVNVMLDATRKAPRNAYSYAQLANTLVPEWQKAAAAHDFHAMRDFARTIAAATERARHCENFDEFFVTSGPLLVTTGQVLHASGFGEEAVPFFEAALAPKFSRFKAAIEVAHKELAAIARERAKVQNQPAPLKP